MALADVLLQAPLQMIMDMTNSPTWRGLPCLLLVAFFNLLRRFSAFLILLRPFGRRAF